MYSRLRHPPKTFPPDHVVDLEEAAMGWALRLARHKTYILCAVGQYPKQVEFSFVAIDLFV